VGGRERRRRADIDVENWPKDVIAGRDPQLERAVEEAMRLLKETPARSAGERASAADVGSEEGRRRHQLTLAKTNLTRRARRARSVIAGGHHDLTRGLM
jgi:hypothetical protein